MPLLIAQNREINKLMSQEQAVQNRVKYLEETQNKLTEQVAVMQA